MTDPNGGTRRSVSISPSPSGSEGQFDPRVLDRTVIARPLLDELAAKGDDVIVNVIIDLNLNFPGGRNRARERVRDLVSAAMAATGGRRQGQGVDNRKTDLSDLYVFARLTGGAVRALVRLDAHSVAKSSTAP